MDKAEEMTGFLYEVNRRFEDFCKRFNSESEVKNTTWDCPLGDIQVMMSRGDVFEKASAIYCDLEIDTPPVLAEQMKTNRKKMKALVLEIGIHPVNPFVPKGYIELRAHVTDSIALAGGTDIFPYFPNERDRDRFASAMQDLCTRHGQDYAAMQKVRSDFFKSRYSKDSVGSHAGFYSFYLTGDQMPFFREMPEAFFEAYGRLVMERKGEAFSQADIEFKKKIHGDWVKWILLEDDGTRFGLEKGIPAEALLGAILPPVATF